MIVTTVAIISNAVARWRTMHVSRLQNVRCVHSLNTKLTILWNFPCPTEEIKTMR